MQFQLTNNQKNLIRRYFVWCYKTTKEDLDRVDRYFTQKIVDDYLFECLVSTEDFQSSTDEGGFKDLVRTFENYKSEKINKAIPRKFADQKRQELNPDYLYLTQRLSAIKKAVIHFLGESELKRVEEMYEEEMTRRILSARDHT